MSEKMPPYCNDYLNRSRFATREVKIGNVGFGGSNPVRIQSMTTTDTMDTEASVKQSIRMIDAGCELVRLTAPSKKDAENLLNIKSALVERGYETPLVADIHFTPNAAEIAAKIVEKVRVNPGNYADKKRFEEIDYTNESYQAELDRIEKKFTPLVLLCKEEGTAMRIGTNHGSLSDRILSRYGDTPEGMVESAMEFLNICRKHDFHDIVLSMKASNTLVMVQAYRLLMATMAKHGMNYPIHLGVTEAGDGEDGRIKSAVGIGALLEDGIGDTVRVSLTEAPEAEIPVAQKLVDKFSKANNLTIDYKITDLPYNPYAYRRYNTNNVGKVGSGNVPVVIADVSEINEVKPSHLFGYGYMYSVPLDKWNLTDSAADFVYIGNKVLNFEVPGTLQVLCDLEIWQSDYQSRDGFFPIIDGDSIDKMDSNQVFFLRHNAVNSDVTFLENYPNCVVILESEHANKAQLYRNIHLKFAKNGVKSPVILSSRHDSEDVETFQLWTSSDLGVSLIDGFGDGVWLQGKVSSQIINATSFGILQATRTRISKTEYISCPSCGRTLFDLQETTAKIRAKTSHLKGVKIGIMGCIVNGPGEMADADYGYVGTGPGKIHLYKEKEVVRKNVPEDEAVDALIDLIREHGDWLEPVS